MKKKLFLLGVFFALIAYLTVASATDAETPEKNSNSLEEAQAYKMLYEDLKEANGKILDTVYFALTFAGTFIILFLTINAFFAQRTRKKEFQALESENEVSVLKMKNELRKEMKEEFTKLVGTHEEKIKNLFDTYSNEINKMNIKATSSMDVIKKDLSKLSSEINKIQGNLEFDNKNFESALYYFVQVAKNSGKGFGFEDDLNKINETLLKIDSISTFYLGIVTDFIEELPKKLPESQSIIIARIKELLKTIEIY
ncbi:hypothetical protein J7E55_27225 [Bacillus sp. ISL-53]|nr:hypothetical protein [Bacillus sp. ISL-53]